MKASGVLALLPLFGLIAHVVGQVRGVNIGGWLVTEEWITPSVYNGLADDEWNLCNTLGKQQCLSTLQKHWSSFYTRDDFVSIKAAGLNTIRIPLGYWAVDIQEDEPYVAGQYPYLIQAVQWAGQLGLSVLIDLHGAPGSQNGQDNSGLIGPVLFPSNTTNADRSLNVLKNLTEEFTRTIYGGTVVAVELLNEPRLGSNITDNFSMQQLKSFYSNGSSVISGASNNALNVTVHDAFYGPEYWADYDPANAVATKPATHLTLDTHQYYAFAPLNNLTQPEILESVCNISKLLKQPSSMTGIPPTVVGEWSLETGQSPSPYQQSQDDGQARRTWFRLFFESQVAAYTPNGPGQSILGFIFWAWKTEYDVNTWSYREGIAQGYIPADISNASQLVFPVLENGCVDATFNYTAPLYPGASIRVEAIGALFWTALALAVAFGMAL